MGHIKILLILLGLLAFFGGNTAVAVTREFTGPQGGPFVPNNQTIELFCLGTDAGNSELMVDFALQNGPQWLTVTPANGRFSCAAPRTLQLQLNAQANQLPVGTESATVMIVTRGAIEDTVSVTVNVTVQPSRAALRAVSPLEARSTLQTRESLMVELRDNNNRPLSGVSLTWELLVRTPALEGAETGARIEILTPESDNLGRSEAIFETGNRSGVFGIRVTAGSSALTFTREVGIAAVIDDVNRPEAAVGSAIDSLCPQMVVANERGELNRDQQRLLEQCSQLIGESADSNLPEALRGLAPTGNLSFKDLGERTVNAQFTNLGNRLTALRSGAPAGALSQLNLHWGSERLSGHQLALLAQGIGAGAGDTSTLDPNVLLGGRLGAFLSGNARFGKRSTTSQDDGFKFNSYGLTGGVDYRFTSDLILGAALGLATGDLENSGDSGKIDNRGVSFSVYGNYFLSPDWYVEGIMSYALNRYDQIRRLRYQLGELPPVDERFRSRPDGTQFGVTLGTGYDWRFETGLTASLRGKANYLRSQVDGYTENNAASGLNLRLGKLDAKSLVMSVEGQVVQPLSYNWGVLLPQGSVALEYEMLNDPLTIQARFVNDPFNTPIRFKTDRPDRGYLRLGIGMAAVLTGGTTLFFNYDGLFARKNYDYDFTLSAGLRVEFD